MKFMTFITIYRRKFSAYYFIRVIFWHSNSASNFAFYDTHIEFCKKIGVLLALFANFEVEFGPNGKIYKCVLELNFCIRSWRSNRCTLLYTFHVLSLYTYKEYIFFCLRSLKRQPGFESLLYTLCNQLG